MIINILFGILIFYGLGLIFTKRKSKIDNKYSKYKDYMNKIKKHDFYYCPVCNRTMEDDHQTCPCCASKGSVIDVHLWNDKSLTDTMLAFEQYVDAVSHLEEHAKDGKYQDPLLSEYTKKIKEKLDDICDKSKKKIDYSTSNISFAKTPTEETFTQKLPEDKTEFMSSKWQLGLIDLEIDAALDAQDFDKVKDLIEKKERLKNESEGMDN